MRWLALLVVLAAPAPAPALARAPLRIAVIDVEGGAATLYVTPGGRSLLIDAGWPPPDERLKVDSTARIVAAARALGLQRIDYLVVTHYHVDHVGGVPALVAAFPVGTLIDHGANREPSDVRPPPRWHPAALYPVYRAATRGLTHRTMHAGETLTIDGLRLTAIDSDRRFRRVPVGARPGRACDTAGSKADVGGEENPRSLGLLLEWGRTRILSLADTTWNVETALVCPLDRIGPVDLMFADNHGSRISNSPALIATVAPRVVVIANGSTKGADPETFATLARVAPSATIWQLHRAERAGALNTSQAQIVNMSGANDHGDPLLVEVDEAGGVLVHPPR